MDRFDSPTPGLLFEVTDRVVVAQVREGGPKGRPPVEVALAEVARYLGKSSDQDHYIEFNYDGRDYVVSSTKESME